jgi:hypothetical protein
MGSSAMTISGKPPQRTYASRACVRARLALPIVRPVLDPEEAHRLREAQREDLDADASPSESRREIPGEKPGRRARDVDAHVLGVVDPADVPLPAGHLLNLVEEHVTRALERVGIELAVGEEDQVEIGQRDRVESIVGEVQVQDPPTVDTRVEDPPHRIEHQERLPAPSHARERDDLRRLQGNLDAPRACFGERSLRRLTDHVLETFLVHGNTLSQYCPHDKGNYGPEVSLLGHLLRPLESLPVRPDDLPVAIHDIEPTVTSRTDRSARAATARGRGQRTTSGSVPTSRR